MKLKKQQKKDKTPAVVAHIVPKSAKRGDGDTNALCGVKIVGEPQGKDVPVCFACFVKQLEADDTRTESAAAEARRAASEQARQRYDRGVTDGVANGRRAYTNELAEMSRAMDAAARAEAREPRYEDLGDALKLKVVDGGEVTVRKDRVAQVQLLQNGQSHAVIVDGHAIHVGTDEELARHHYDDVHSQIFQPANNKTNQEETV